METIIKSGTRKKAETLAMILLWITVIMGSSYFGVSLSLFTVSPYRMVFMISLAMMVGNRYLCLPIRTKNMLVFYALWVFVSFLSLLWAPDKASCIKAGIVLAIAFLSIIITYQFVQNTKIVHIILVTISLVYIFSAWVGLYESLTGNYLFVNKVAILNRMAIDKYRAPLVFFTNQNDYSLFLVFGMLVSLYIIENTKGFWLHVVYYITLLISLWVLFFAGSRGCMLAVAVGAFVWFLLRIKESQSNSKVLIWFLIISLALFAGIIYSSKLEYFYSFYFHFGLSNSSTTSDSTRWQLLKNGINMIYSTAGIGVGAANSPYYLEKYYANTHGIWALHNWILQIFSEFGVIIGIGYIIQYFSMLMKLESKYKKSMGMDKLQARLFISVLIMLIIGTISPSSVLTMEWLWMLMGLILVYIELPIMTEMENSESK